MPKKSSPDITGLGAAAKIKSTIIAATIKAIETKRIAKPFFLSVFSDSLLFLGIFVSPLLK